MNHQSKPLQGWELEQTKWGGGVAIPHYFKYRLFNYLHIELSACREMSAVIPINPVILLGFFLNAPLQRGCI